MSKQAPLQITLKAARVNAKFTQEEVARKLRINKQTVVNWENDLSEPKLRQAKALCNLYGITLNDIFLPD